MPDFTGKIAVDIHEIPGLKSGISTIAYNLPLLYFYPATSIEP